MKGKKTGGRQKGTPNKPKDPQRELVDLRAKMRIMKATQPQEKVYHYYAVPDETNLVERSGRIGMVVKDIERMDQIIRERSGVLADEVPAVARGSSRLKPSGTVP